MLKKITKNFIEEQKKKLEKEVIKIDKQISSLKEEDPFSDPDHASDNAAVDTDVREQVGHETVEAQIKNLETRKKEVKLALQKIKKGKYGRCEKCGNEIPLKRLQIVPEALFCVQCEESLRK